jgi:(p)ppGpp synthase/HD superfamily hydrolase
MSMPGTRNEFIPAKAPVTQLTHRFTEALAYVMTLHTETRKGTSVPYFAHLLGVASLVLGENGYVDFPVTEDMVMAALLHDAGEDKGGEERLADIRARFGPEVERIVRGCSDSLLPEGASKEDWVVRKARYVDSLKNHEADVLLVCAADKLYNARAILEDYREVGDEVWTRFKKGRDDQIRNFRALLVEFRRLGTNRIVEEFARTIESIDACGSKSNRSLPVRE